MHNFKIKPGVPLTLSFPYKISETIYGDSKHYLVTEITPKTLGIKLLNTKTVGRSGYDNGFTILFDGGNKISFILHPTIKNDYDVTINFYEGSLPKNSKIAQKSAELESNFEKKIEAYEAGFAIKVQKYIAKQLQVRGNLKNLKGAKKSHGITFQSEKRLVIGNRVYYSFFVENNAYEKILPKKIELKTFNLKSGSMRNLKLVRSIKYCNKELLDQKENTLCTFVYKYPKNVDNKFMLELITPTLKQAQMILIK